MQQKKLEHPFKYNFWCTFSTLFIHVSSIFEGKHQEITKNAGKKLIFVSVTALQAKLYRAIASILSL